MELTGHELKRGRYKREHGHVIIDVAVKHSRQLFNERDPAPFRERDLDEDLVSYIKSSVQEFAFSEPMKIRIHISEESERILEGSVIQQALQSFFNYEANLTQANLRKRMRVGRLFLGIGLLILFVCLGIAQLLEPYAESSPIVRILNEGLVIIGWVAMWRPVEVFLYDWWPLFEQKKVLFKIANMDVEVHCS